ncbi:MAG TPA: 50S ribosomal protein L6 [Patescibacteria group bacterium]|nr:50S ribosomal protein L6 [Patescibacteria group bacterium]
MSKIGKQPITIPEGVAVEISGQTVKVTGPKGSIERHLARGMKAEVTEGQIIVEAEGKSKSQRSLHGTSRAILANDIEGVTKGWSKQLELVGTGFRADSAGSTLNLIVGYSHPVKVEAPAGITFKVEKMIITVEGIDREIVGQVAANVRKVRPPEPYKGKGIKYMDEVIRRKAGKAAAKTTGAPA